MSEVEINNMKIGLGTLISLVTTLVLATLFLGNLYGRLTTLEADRDYKSLKQQQEQALKSIQLKITEAEKDIAALTSELNAREELLRSNADKTENRLSEIKEEVTSIQRESISVINENLLEIKSSRLNFKDETSRELESFFKKTKNERKIIKKEINEQIVNVKRIISNSANDITSQVSNSLDKKMGVILSKTHQSTDQEKEISDEINQLNKKVEKSSRDIEFIINKSFLENDSSKLSECKDKRIVMHNSNVYKEGNNLPQNKIIFDLKKGDFLCEIFESSGWLRVSLANDQNIEGWVKTEIVKN